MLSWRMGPLHNSLGFIILLSVRLCMFAIFQKRTDNVLVWPGWDFLAGLAAWTGSRGSTRQVQAWAPLGEGLEFEVTFIVPPCHSRNHVGGPGSPVPSTGPGTELTFNKCFFAWDNFPVTNRICVERGPGEGEVCSPHCWDGCRCRRCAWEHKRLWRCLAQTPELYRGPQPEGVNYAGRPPSRLAPSLRFLKGTAP